MSSEPQNPFRAGSLGSQHLKICIVTSHGLGEPRGVRHAFACRRALPDADIEFIHYAADFSSERPDILQEMARENISVRALRFPTRPGSPIRWLVRKIVARAARIIYRFTGRLVESVFSERTIGLGRQLSDSPAHIYFAHNFEALMPAATAAERNSGILIFDCMEFYSDMGDGQRREVSRAIGDVEARYLPRCSLVTAASQELASAYAETYDIPTPLVVYNTAPTCKLLPPRRGGGLNLYWRNSVLGFGQRGLEDALEAMAGLPHDVHLYLQGHAGADDGGALCARIAALRIGDKVTILRPHPPGEAVPSAALYDVGLCLERRFPRNHQLTVSNKMFDYHMAGLAVIASDVPGLRTIIRRSSAGVLFEPGDVGSLCKAVLRLRNDPAQLAEMQNNARRHALSIANMEIDLDRVAQAVASLANSHFAPERAPVGQSRAQSA